MGIQGLGLPKTRDLAFFAAFLAYVWAGIDTRLIYHWQAPVFYTFPGFVNDFLRYPGGPADYLYALIAQTYAFQGWGAVVVTAQVAAVVALTRALLKGLALVSFLPALILLYFLNLYYDRTPLLLAMVTGLGAAALLLRISRNWRSEAAQLGLYVALLGVVYYLAGMAVVFFALAASLARRRNWKTLVYLAAAAALPVVVERLRLTSMASPPTGWFVDPDSRRTAVLWGLYLFYAAGAAFAFRWAGRKPAPPLVQLLPLVALAAVASASYSANLRDRNLSAVDYYSDQEDWPAVIDASRRVAPGDFNSLLRYEVNLALHETNRLGDDMFRFPQAGSMLLDPHDDRFVPYMIKLTGMCLRLGRLNEAEHFGSEAMVLGKSDPRVYKAMAQVNLVKGQTAAARKFLTVLSYDLIYGPWARRQIQDLDGGAETRLLRARMLRNDDMMAVWQRADKPSADMERLLLDQLEQDSSNRMAFEFLVGNYLLARDMVALHAVMPRIKDMTGPAYVGVDGRRRTPRHYQEALAIYGDVTGQPVAMEGLEIQPETVQRMNDFKRLLRETSTREAGMDATREAFGDTYFFYFAFGSGGGR